jgi:hypothetical protein
MSRTQATEGETISLSESFVDNFEDPLVLVNTESGPQVLLYDHQKDIVFQTIGVPDPNGQPGDWSASIPIPDIGLVEAREFCVVFTFKDEAGDTYKSRQNILIQPASETRVTDIVVIVGRDRIFQFGIPVEFSRPVDPVPGDVSSGTPGIPGIPGDELSFSLFRNNVALYGDEGLSANDPLSGVVLTSHVGKTTVSLPAVVGDAKLEPLVLLADYTTPAMMAPTTYTYKVWPITPAVLGAASQLEDFINKARVENVIPELDYTQADLVQYLHRGLALFNSYGAHISAFTGTNMQGPILDAWLLCASYYALASQLQAEGALAFDFSGQTVSLNIDRTPAIESALGRVEGMLEQQVKPLKKLLSKAGALSGDGSAGGRYIDGSRSLGTLGIINAPTSRINTGGRRGSWFQPFF